MKTKVIIISCIVLMLAPAVLAMENNETYSYIIYKVGNTVYAKNGVTGVIDSSSINAADVFSYAITHLPSNGGKIFVKAGGYSLSYGMPIVHGLHIIGENIISTSIECTASSPMFSYSGSTDISFFALEHMSLSGGPNCPNCVKTNEHVHDGLIYNCYLLHFTGDSVDLGSTCGWRLDQMVTEYNGGDGIHMRGGSGGYITNCKSIINDGNAIQLENSEAVTVVGNYLGSSGKNGVFFNNTNRCTLIGNCFYKDDKYKTGLYSDIYLTPNSMNNIIIGNQIEGAGSAKYNIYLGPTSLTSRNILALNRMVGSVSGSIQRDPSNSDLINANFGYMTEKYGTCTITNANSVVVTHGLSTIPKSITITPKGVFAKYYVGSITSTSFTLYVNRTLTGTFYWSVFA